MFFVIKSATFALTYLNPHTSGNVTKTVVLLHCHFLLEAIDARPLVLDASLVSPQKRMHPFDYHQFRMTRLHLPLS